MSARAAVAPLDDPSMPAPLGSGAMGSHGGRRPPAPGEEHELVARLRAGDEAAFGALIDEHSASMRRLARLYCSDAVADDVVQETWIAVVTGIDRFEGRAAIRTWIYSILVNIARSRGVQEHRQIPFSAFTEPEESSEAAVDPDRFRPAGDEWAGHWVSYPQRWDELPEQRFLSTEGVHTAMRAIEALPPAQREVVTLRDVEGWSSDEVVEALHLTPANQRVLLHRGRSKVRAALELALAGTTADTEGPSR